MPRPRLRVAAVLTVVGLVWLLVGALGGAVGATEAPSTPGTVGTTTIRGPITPVIADHLRDIIAEADRQGFQAMVVSLDTPGGLVTSMRLIVQDFLNAPLPIIVHVAPPGADAGSAGTFITLAAHVAAMAPATTIGAATPVDLQGGEVGDKIVNNAAAYAEAIAEARGRDVDFAVASVRDGRSITADAALEIGAIDLIADDLDDLLRQIDGTTVELADGREIQLATATAPREPLEMTWTRQLLQLLADPNVAFLLLSLATLAILYEIANPGVGAGGVTGAVSLVLGLYALSVLPVAMAGVALLIVAAVLFAIEVVVPGIGVAAGGGTIALLLAGLFLFQRPTGIGIDLAILLPTVVVTAAAAVGIGVAAARTRGMPSVVVSDELIGRTAALHGTAEDHPRVQLDGTFWRVRPASPDVLDGIAEGDLVRVVARDNLDLVVTPATDAEPTPRSTTSTDKDR